MGERPKTFVSTRGGASYTFKEAVLAGWADDGGMILPQKLPTLTRETLTSWRGLPYPRLVHELLVLFLDEAIPGLQGMIDSAFSTFSTDKVVEFRPLSGESGTGEAVAELFHGPSLAFKDLGMQVLAKLIEHYLSQSRSDMTFLVGTSGDTGPSALEAVQGKGGMRLIVLYPLGRVSDTQEAQMLRAHSRGGNCRVVAVEGTSDDLDEPVTQLFLDKDFRNQHRLGSLNSVNIVRLVVQVFHYVYAYLHLTHDSPAWAVGDGRGSNLELPRVSFAIPTGAAGHVTAGVMASLMGLPIHRLLMATNENDILSRMVSEGVLEKKGDVVPTNSPAMDIQAPYNVERIFHMLWDGLPDGSAIGSMMESFYRGEAVHISDHITGRLRALGVCCESVGKGQGPESVLGTIQQVYESDAYLLDPHTAVGVAAARRLAAKGALSAADGSTPPVVCMGCAHPAKFAPTIAEALGLDQAKAVELIASKSHASVRATLDLAETLKAGGMQVQCPRFYEKERDLWSSQLKDMIKQLA